jgi:hypothetical protein
MNDIQRSKLNNSSPVAQETGLGDLLFRGIGNEYYLDPVNGSDSNNGLSSKTAFKSYAVAYAALTANQNDILYVIGGATAVVLSAAATWAKDYTHMIGIGSNLRFGGRTRIAHTGTAMATMFTVSASGCIFHNIHWQHGEASATNLICLLVSGLRNEFNNCHVEASLDSVASGSSYAWRAIQLASAAQANTFKKCTVGSWTTAWASTSGKLVQFVGDNADTYFDDCVFVMNHTSTSFVPIDFTGPISGANSSVAFLNCKFFATNAKNAVIFGIPTNGWIFLDKCNAFNVTAWSTTNAKLIEGNGAANASGTGLGVAQS